MALSATIFKCQLSVSDLSRHHYQDYSLTLAQHPSETEMRMMVRILAFAIFAHEQLEFSRGLSNDDEPDLWQKNLTGEIENWIELGQPEEKRIRKASALAKQVVVINYQQNASNIWWQQNSAKLTRFKNLQVISLSENAVEQLASLCSRGMQLQVTIEDGTLWVNNGSDNLEVEFRQRD
ncbi:MAG: YaeQ family protein [Saccharospirillaceae bacterium]|nr:YaeQ family protein [Saccharospirillaceae bacterium]